MTPKEDTMTIEALADALEPFEQTLTHPETGITFRGIVTLQDAAETSVTLAAALAASGYSLVRTDDLAGLGRAPAIAAEYVRPATERDQG